MPQMYALILEFQNDEFQHFVPQNSILCQIVPNMLLNIYMLGI